jgi:hypothetical protein
MPRAYIDTILSSKPGRRRRYLAISCGSKVDSRSRGIEVDHVTLYRWVQRFAPELEKRLQRHLRPCRGRWRVDQTYLRVDGQWRYLYRAVDGTGQTIEFMLSAKRDKKVAKRFFCQAAQVVAVAAVEARWTLTPAG